MKKLISILASVGILIFAGSSMPNANLKYQNQKNIFRELGIPSKFLNYEKNEVGSAMFIGDGKAIGVKTYKVDGDKILDVRELYALEKNEKGEFYFGESKPFQYLFNNNQNEEFGEQETLFDPNKNGLSGDEKWFYQIASEGESEITLEEISNRL